MVEEKEYPDVRSKEREVLREPQEDDGREGKNGFLKRMHDPPLAFCGEHDDVTKHYVLRFPRMYPMMSPPIAA